MRSWQVEGVRTQIELSPEAFINKSREVFKEVSSTNELIMKWFNSIKTVVSSANRPQATWSGPQKRRTKKQKLVPLH